MFQFFKSKKTDAPLDYELRKYFEGNFLWFMQEFAEPVIEDRKLLLPIPSDFPIEWNKSKENAHEALAIICKSMQINPDNIKLNFYTNGIKAIEMGTSTIFLEADPENPVAAGLYHSEMEDGKFVIALDEANLEKPDQLIATIAHELAHVKLLGENRIEENDEMLTDFATVFFGLGIFSANTAFDYYQNKEIWGYSMSGYLKIEEWAYALALFAFMRHENNPTWKVHLKTTIKADFEKSLQYMLANENEIFDMHDEQE